MNNKFQTKYLLVIALFFISGFASFENHLGEKFPFSIKQMAGESPAPTVMISHGGSCRTAQEDQWANRIKSWGFNVVLMDHCSGRGIGPHTGVEPPTLKPQDRVDDYIAIAEWVKTQPWHQGKVAVFGISRGGEAVLRAAEERFDRGRRGLEGLKELDVYVALYPACSYVPRTPRAPLLVMHGEADNLAVFSQCDYAARTHENFTIKTYRNAHHGFDMNGGDILGTNPFLGSFVVRRYDKDAAEQSFADAKKFFETHMK